VRPRAARTALTAISALTSAAAAIAAAALLVLGLVTAGTSAGATSPRIRGPFQPYFPPPFANSCTVHYFGEGVAPPLRGIPDDPLCVDYAKRDITITDGGAIRFLAAEPSRVLVAVPKCQYWQQDHWSVQLAPGTLALIRWDGSYWWDEGAGQAGAILAHLSIGGIPMNAQQAADLVRPFSRKLAQFFLDFAEDGPGGGYAGTIPFNPLCVK
jgi:hypothetical protein